MRLTRITDLEFSRVKAKTRMRPKSLAIVYEVLVKGRPQKDLVIETGESRQNVSLIVNNFWDDYEAIHAVPENWVTATLSLPPSDWKRVHAIEKEAKVKLAALLAKTPRTKLTKAVKTKAST
jgi:TrfB plasmid transcriptional repressor